MQQINVGHFHDHNNASLDLAVHIKPRNIMGPISRNGTFIKTGSQFVSQVKVLQTHNLSVRLMSCRLTICLSG